ncbi:major facilitator superfamily [Dendryphion nanum]|uniref:Major facilitator superfamily n=1 Tax=Dendryphion nanum TaxID=256645 RepID=A0A9P9DUL1_9PLEO|nr:major facilitator superfamily [Dendryphion nanum]
MIPFGVGIAAGLPIAEKIGAGKDQASWIAASYPLTQGAFVLAGGRIGSIFGPRKVLIYSASWWVLWHLISGFTRNIIGLCFTRGLAGIGGGFLVPNAIALIGMNVPPGKMRNIAMGAFGAMAPIGAVGGGVFSGLFTELAHWKWTFFFLAMVGTVVFGLSAIAAPPDEILPSGNNSIDWLGSYLGIGGLILFGFVFNQAPSVGWREPYVYVLLIVSVAHLIAFMFWERNFAENPLLPFDIWIAPSFGALVGASLLTFMSFGVVLWYFFIWLETVKDYSILLSAAGISPFVVFGPVAAFVSAWLIPRLRAQYILATGALCVIVPTILLATSPIDQIYWAQIFPGVLIMTFCPDFVFTAAQIIASNAVKRHEQGIAGSLIGALITYGQSIGLGLAGSVERYAPNGSHSTELGIRNALYFGIGLGALALIIALVFVRMAVHTQEGWGKEDAEDTGVLP